MDDTPIDRPTYLGPGELAIFARETDPTINGDLNVAFRLVNGASQHFANDAGVVSLTYDGQVLDSVSYSSATEAVAWEMDSALIVPGVDPSVNDDASAFCASSLRYGRFGIYGSPGIRNSPCP